MLVRYRPFITVPFFWSSFFGHNIIFAGYACRKLERVIIEGDANGMQFIAYYLEGNKVQAVATVDRDPVAVACVELMQRDMMPTYSELMFGSVNAEVIAERVRQLGRQENVGQ